MQVTATISVRLFAYIKNTEEKTSTPKAIYSYCKWMNLSNGRASTDGPLYNQMLFPAFPTMQFNSDNELTQNTRNRIE